jgi:hypothetical protein
VTFFGSSSGIDDLGPNGGVTVINGDRRYRWSLASGGILVDIGSSLGWGIWQDGKLLIVVGGTVFKVP